LDTYVKDYVKYQVEYSRSLLLPPNINTIAEYMRRYGSADWRPDMAGSEGVRVSENMLPGNPTPPKAPEAAKTAAPTKSACPPGTAAAATAALGARGAGAATVCQTVDVLKKK
jgi:hypothetical protein